MRENEEESTSPVLFLLVLFTNLLLQFFLLLLVVFSKYLRYPVHYSLLYTPLFICCSFASPVLNNRATSAIYRAQCAVFFFFPLPDATRPLCSLCPAAAPCYSTPPHATPTLYYTLTGYKQRKMKTWRRTLFYFEQQSHISAFVP